MIEKFASSSIFLLSFQSHTRVCTTVNTLADAMSVRNIRDLYTPPNTRRELSL
uniref:Uncharacterized protein n=1 Tax=Arundo donax TaxID=35708 RepID=A0A0A8Y4D7_ARUDO